MTTNILGVLTAGAMGVVALAGRFSRRFARRSQR
jgi:hypothetical protein